MTSDLSLRDSEAWDCDDHQRVIAIIMIITVDAQQTNVILYGSSLTEISVKKNNKNKGKIRLKRSSNIHYITLLLLYIRFTHISFSFLSKNIIVNRSDRNTWAWEWSFPHVIISPTKEIVNCPPDLVLTWLVISISSDSVSHYSLLLFSSLHFILHGWMMWMRYIHAATFLVKIERSASTILSKKEACDANKMKSEQDLTISS